MATDSLPRGKEGVQRRPSKRKPNSVKLLQKAQAEIKKLFGDVDWDPVVFLMLVAADSNEDKTVRINAASKAAPYVHATLKAVELTGDDGGPMQVNLTGAKERLAAMLLPPEEDGAND